MWIRDKNKAWIKTRVFLSFWIFIIIFTNIFAILLYVFVEKSFIENLKESIETEYKNITEIIRNEKTQLLQISEEETNRIKELWLFFYIWNNEKSIIENYYLWYFVYWENIIFRQDFDWYNILIWKNIRDLNKFKQNIIDITIILNIFWLFITFIISYFVTNRVLNPLIRLAKYISNYDITENKTLILNKYWDSEIWLITEALNKFIWETKEILESHKYFIQDTSHELKTPLMQITSNIELIEWKIKDPEVKEKFENIKISIENINNIISNLGFLMRWSEKSIKKELLDVGKYLKEFIKNFKYDTKEKNIKIIVNETEKLTLENNTYYLDRLFWNLISNAIFYNNWDNTITITVYNNKVTIEDEWIWIEETDLKRVFNRFYRNNNSDSYNNDWSGLGLAIVKKIADSFGWKITIESKLWKWTKVELKVTS
jgi:signal transduction histidine kinase